LRSREEESRKKERESEDSREKGRREGKDRIVKKKKTKIKEPFLA